MNKYAVIELSGKQFIVSEGDEFVTDRLSEDEDSEFSTEKVLLVKNSKEVQIGQPYVENAEVTLKVNQHQRSKKLRVAKYKAKSRYRRVKGHRQHQSVVKVVSIS